MTWDLRLGAWEKALADVESVDTLITDTPYSEKTHAGHDRALKRGDKRIAMADGTDGRRELSYRGWTSDDVRGFVRAWAPRTRGWFLSITDHVLAPTWADELERCGRYVFSPISLVEIGSRVRIVGDGPTQWSCWIIASRPRTMEFKSWGALPGAYVTGAERKPVIGGKPLSIMRELVRDYSRPNDLVCDPCAGGGTTLLAAHLEGRRSIGSEMDPDHWRIATDRLRELPRGSGSQLGIFDRMEAAG